MTKKELSELLNIDVKTLRNWEKTKPELIKLINLGLQVDKQINQIEENLEILKEIKQNSENGKILL